MKKIVEHKTSPNPSTGGENSTSPLEERFDHDYITANAWTYPLIKDEQQYLKRYQTESEKALWHELRNKKTGYKIRRQHVVDRFIVDFICLEKKVIIEVDGNIHNSQKERDRERDARLKSLGYTVIRISNSEIAHHILTTVNKITTYLNTGELPSCGGVGGGL